MELKVYDKTGILRTTLYPASNSTQTEAIQEDCYISASMTSNECVRLLPFDYVDFLDKRYWVSEAYTPKQNSTIEWVYDVKFYGAESLGKNALMLTSENVPMEAYTGNAADQLAQVVRNLNRWSDSDAWSVGSVDTTAMFDVDYSGGTYATDALKKIVDAAKEAGYELEWWMDGQKVHLTKCEIDVEVLELGYGNGLLSLDRVNASNVPFFTRLYPVGSDKNINYGTYGHTRLQLPGGDKYKDVNVDKFGIVERYEEDTFKDIYPRRTGTVTAVRTEQATSEDGTKYTIYYVQDNAIPFNPNNYEIVGLVKHLVFKTGNMAGRDMEVNWNDTTKEFEIITTWPYSDSTQIPGGLIVPAVGDTYVLYNITLPSEYYPLAEAEYEAAVEAYLARYSSLTDRSVYKAKTDYIELDERTEMLRIGRKVKLLSDKLFPETGFVNSRITRITRSLERPNGADIEISDVLGQTSTSTTLNSITDLKESGTKEIDDRKANDGKVVTYSRRLYSDAMESISLLASTVDGFTSGITPVAIQTMSLLLGDESLQFRFVDSKTAPQEVAHNIAYSSVSKQLTVDAGILQHLTLGIDKVSPVHAASEYKYWDMPAFTSSVLVDTKVLFLYAKCSKTDQTGEFVLSETAIKMEAVDGYYHLFVGILNSEQDGDRSWTEYYGFAELTPGRLLIDLIASANGLNYFDLKNNRFRIGDADSGLDWNVSSANSLTLLNAAIKLIKDGVVKFSIDPTTGNVEVQGKVSTSADGNRIVVDPVTQSILLITVDDEIVGSWKFASIPGTGVSQIEMKNTGLGFLLSLLPHNVYLTRTDNGQVVDLDLNNGITLYDKIGTSLNRILQATKIPGTDYASMSIKGDVNEYAFTQLNPSANSYVSIADDSPSINMVILKSTHTNSGFILPPRPIVCSRLGISSTDTFRLKFTIIADADSTEDGLLYGRTTDIAGANLSTIPQRLNTVGQPETGALQMARGDSLEYLLVYDGINYRAYELRHTI